MPRRPTASSTIEPVFPDSTDGKAHFGQKVTFTISTTVTEYPYVELQCYQDGNLVGHGWQGFFPTALGNPWFQLGPSPAWTEGDADCVAKLGYYNKGRWQDICNCKFHTYDP